jgi:hypothetical protein
LKDDYTLKKIVYGNHKMYSIEDEFLSHVDTKRMKWYLDRNLAMMINEKDFKLTFKSKGNQAQGEYYKLELKNICVICGTGESLTKHHVVPTQYRKYLPMKYKSKSSFDVLCVCIECHHSYEIIANVLKEDLLKKYDLIDESKHQQKIKKYHHVLNNHSEFLSDEKRLDMVNFMEEFLDDSIENILSVDCNEFESTSSLLMKNITDYKEFIIMWREHFIKNADPKHLPQEWYDEINIVIRG